MSQVEVKAPKGRYRKIEVRTWSDEKFRELSPMAPSGQALWFFLLTGPHTGPVPGLFRAGPAAMAEELGWSADAFREAFRDVSEKGMVEADFKARLVWLPNAIRYNKPESPNVVRSWRVELDMLPECDLKRRAIAALREYLTSLGPAYISAFCEVLGEPAPETHGKASRKASRKASAKTMPNQEQEQEQEQEKSKSSAPAARPPAPKPRACRLPDGWKPSPGLIEQCRAMRPDVDVTGEIDAFGDYWRAKAGKDAAKLDWDATFRNWIRRSTPDKARARASPGRPSIAQNFSEKTYVGTPDDEWPEHLRAN